jgi:hypothetical protein
MIKIASLLFLLTISLFAENPFFKKLPFKEAIVEYSLSGSQKGFQTLYIKEYGKYRVYYKNVKTNFMSKKKKKEEYIIETPKWIYYLNGDKTASRTPNFKYLLYVRYKDLSKKEQAKVLENLKLLNYIPIEDKKFKVAKNFTTIDEIKCDLLMQKAKKECFGYSGALLLKSQIKFLGFNSTKLLTNIFETKIDPKLFDISDIKITDDKLKSVKLYEKSAKVINFLKRKLNPKAIFINVKASDKDVQEIIQEGIKSLSSI